MGLQSELLQDKLKPSENTSGLASVFTVSSVSLLDLCLCPGSILVSNCSIVGGIFFGMLVSTLLHMGGGVCERHKGLR